MMRRFYYKIKLFIYETFILSSFDDNNIKFSYKTINLFDNCFL